MCYTVLNNGFYSPGILTHNTLKSKTASTSEYIALYFSYNFQMSMLIYLSTRITFSIPVIHSTSYIYLISNKINFNFPVQLRIHMKLCPNFLVDNCHFMCKWYGVHSVIWLNVFTINNLIVAAMIILGCLLHAFEVCVRCSRRSWRRYNVDD